MNAQLIGRMERPSAFPSEFGGFTDSFWDGNYGVVDHKRKSFSANYVRYGIEVISSEQTDIQL